MGICQCVSVGLYPQTKRDASMGRVVILRNTYSLADEEKYAWRGLAGSLGMFPRTDASLLSTPGCHVFQVSIFVVGAPPAVYASG
jgi:hypothetical protein